MREAGGLGDDASKPTWRGRLHQVAFFVAVPAGVVLVAIARTTTGKVAGGIYAATVAGLYGASAAYHRARCSQRVRRWLKRLDHSMIFALIAGTATPFSLLVLRPPWSVAFLSVVWGGAVAGVILKAIRLDGFRVLTGILYVGLGWTAILLIPAFIRRLNPGSLVLLLVGGVLYTAGAVVLLRNKPDPAPATFGYHEIWHSMVIGASTCHYAAVLLMVTR